MRVVAEGPPGTAVEFAGETSAAELWNWVEESHPQEWLTAHPADLQRTRQALREALDSGKLLEIEHRLANAEVGGFRWFLTRAWPKPDCSGTWVWRSCDIHALKAREEALREQKDCLELLTATVPGVLYSFSLAPDGTMLFPYCSPNMDRLFQIDSDVLHRDATAAFHRVLPEDLGKLLSSIEASARTLAPWRLEFRLQLPDRGIAWLSGHSLPRREPDGTIVWFGHLTDETERVLSSQRLLQQEALLRAIIDNARAVIWVKTLDGRFVMVNRGFCELVQRNAEDILGRTGEELCAASCGLPWCCQEASGLQGGQPLESEEVVRTSDGTSLTWWTTRFPLLDEEGQVSLVASICTDLTERKQLERQFFQAQKMEAVGRLAGGVAHDFNNILTVINGYCDLVLQDLEEGSELYGLVEEIRYAGIRSSRLTRQLLAFSRQAIMVPRHLFLSELVSETQKMLRRLIGEDIELELQLAQEQGQILADPGHLEQLLMNLVVNARDAMPGGGKLCLSTREVQLSNQDSSYQPPAEAGSYVSLKVSDTGTGMSEEVKARIFEPFFTTKDLGKGTGLGLAVVHGVVAQCGGSCRVESEPGRGSSFEFLFPFTAQPEVVQAPPAPASHDSTEARTILLVEDEECVRRVARRSLTQVGHRVLEAESGGIALQYLQNPAQSIDVVLTDVVLPGLGGRELAERAREICPGIAVVFMSGYTTDEVLQRGVSSASELFLQKPFSPDELRDMITRATLTSVV